MSNKNISQSITEAWAKSVATGMVQSQKKEQKRQQLDETSATLHNKAVQHILENDHGFYRPDVDPFFGAVDGGMLRRQRLTEQQAPMSPEAGPALDDETKERRKRYETAFEGPITGREQGKIDSGMEAIKKREEEEFNRRNQENIEREREERGEISQDRVDQAYTGSLTADGGDRAGRGREGLIRARGGNAQDIDIARRGDAARAEAEGRTKFKIAGGRGGHYYGGARITDNQGRTQAEREAQREAERAERESNTREFGLERLKGLDQDRRERLERELGPDADLETLTTAISQERRNQDRVSDRRDSGFYDEEDYNPTTGRLTDSGRAKQDARRAEKQAKREKVRAAAKARNEKARDEADAARNERLARREARRAGKPYTRPGAGKTEKTTEAQRNRNTQIKRDEVIDTMTPPGPGKAIGDLTKGVLDWLFPNRPNSGGGPEEIPTEKPDAKLPDRNTQSGTDVKPELTFNTNANEPPPNIGIPRNPDGSVKEEPPPGGSGPITQDLTGTGARTQAALRKRMEDARKRANA